RRCSCPHVAGHRRSARNSARTQLRGDASSERSRVVGSANAAAGNRIARTAPFSSRPDAALPVVLCSSDDNGYGSRRSTSYAGKITKRRAEFLHREIQNDDRRRVAAPLRRRKESQTELTTTRRHWIRATARLVIQIGMIERGVVTVRALLSPP